MDKTNIEYVLPEEIEMRSFETVSYTHLDVYKRQIKERQYDKLADTLREYLRMEEIYGMLREARIS